MINKQFSGIWRITDMAVWSVEAINILGSANINFDNDDMGSFEFIAVVGFMDCRFAERDGKPFVESSWQGRDERVETSGIGWATVHDNCKMAGHTYFHCGENSSFNAQPFSAPEPYL